MFASEHNVLSLVHNCTNGDQSLMRSAAFYPIRCKLKSCQRFQWSELMTDFTWINSSWALNYLAKTHGCFSQSPINKAVSNCVSTYRLSLKCVKQYAILDKNANKPNTVFQFRGCFFRGVFLSSLTATLCVDCLFCEASNTNREAIESETGTSIVKCCKIIYF